MINTHNLIIDFGKHKGERWTRLPISYLKWMINEVGGDKAEIALSELTRRGSQMPTGIELSAHAVDKASLRLRRIWHQTAKNQDEGLYTWLGRVASEAMATVGDKSEVIEYMGIKFVFVYGEYYPTLKTVI
jgi:hypothetical protein